MTDTRSPSGRPVVDVIEEGLELYSSDGEKLGHIDEINPEFFVVSAGFLGRKQMYLPRSAEERTDGNKVFLNLSRDDIEAQDWSQSGDSEWGQSSSEYEGPRPGQQSAAKGDQMSSQGTRVRRYEEELTPEKTVKENEVRIGKEVVQEQQSVAVPVAREEVRIRTKPVDGNVDDTSDAFQGNEVTIPLREEHAQASTQARAVEEIEVDKVTREDTEEVSGTVRKERFTGADEAK
jgi:uncharacterized protein (TIGR02271 family)